MPILSGKRHPIRSQLNHSGVHDRPIGQFDRQRGAVSVCAPMIVTLLCASGTARRPVPLPLSARDHTTHLLRYALDFTLSRLRRHDEDGTRSNLIRGDFTLLGQPDIHLVPRSTQDHAGPLELSDLI